MTGALWLYHATLETLKTHNNDKDTKRKHVACNISMIGRSED